MKTANPPFSPARSALQDLTNLCHFLTDMIKKDREEKGGQGPSMVYACIFVDTPGMEDPDDRLTVIKANEAKFTPEMLRELGGDCDENLAQRISKLEDKLYEIERMVESDRATEDPSAAILELRDLLKEV